MTPSFRPTVLLAASLSAVVSFSSQAQQIDFEGSYTATPSTNLNAYGDTGGVELTDGDVGSIVWPGAAVTAPLVGWQNIDATATFNFDAPVTIGKITTWFADSDGNAGVGLPESVRVTTTDGFDQLFPVPNPDGSGETVPIDLAGFVITTDNLTLTIARDTTLDNPVCCGGRYEWTMLSEVQFFAADPDAANLNAPASVDLGILPDDPAQVAGQVPIGNAVGVTQDLTVTDLSFSGPDAANFTPGPNPPSLPPGAAGEIAFTFDSGGVPGDYAATLAIASNDPNSPTLVEITARVVVPLVPSTPYQQAVVADNPVLYWTFDEEGDTENARSMVNDVPANELVAQGAATRAPSTTTAGGVSLGRAASFDALLAQSQSRFDAANLAPSTPLEAFAVELWFNIDDTSDRYLSETFAEGGESNQPGVIYNFNQGEFELFAGGRTGTPLTANEWHHVVAAFYGTGNGVQIFVDGVSAELTDRGGGYSQVQSFGRFAIGNTVQNPQSVTGMIDEYAIYDLAEFPDVVDRQDHVAKIVSHYFVSEALQISNISHNANDGTLSIKWESQNGKLYNLRSETGLSTDPRSWPVFGENRDLAANPPENTLTIPLPADAERFFVVEEFPAPPVVVFSDDFESGQGDWTTGSDGAAGTAWELGIPSNVGPAAANSPANCFATNLAANYELDANIWLRSPAIDLADAAGATLRYFHFVDIEEGFDSGSVSILDAADNSVLAVLQDESVDGVATEWTEVTRTVPSDALGGSVKIEFRFLSDELNNFAGWYLDDVKVTVP